MSKTLSNTLKTLIDPDWTHKFGEIRYKLYYTAAPHCEKALEFKDIYGKTVWNCKHIVKKE